MYYLKFQYTKLLKRDQKRTKVTEATQGDLNGKQLLHQVVEVQAILSDLSEDVRPDFLAGVNSACLLTKNDFENLDLLFDLVNPSFEEESSKVNKLSVRVKGATEHLLKVVEGKDQPALDNGTTYKDLRALILKIKSSGYFDKDQENGVDKNVNHTVHETTSTEPEALHEDLADHEEEVSLN